MSNKEPIVLVGGGGHCKSVIEVIESQAKFQIIGILDVQQKVGQKVLGYEIIGTDEEVKKLASKCKNFFVTAGQIKNPSLRIKLFNLIKSSGGQLPVIVAPTAYVSSHATLGEGTVVMHKAFVNAEARIGRNCLINTGAIIEHEAVVEDHTHISTAALINGGVEIKAESFIGSNATVAHGVSLGKGTVVGAGSVVLKSCENRVLLAGNPAQIKKTYE